MRDDIVKIVRNAKGSWGKQLSFRRKLFIEMKNINKLAPKDKIEMVFVIGNRNFRILNFNSIKNITKRKKL